jgi:hypothetical protein
MTDKEKLENHILLVLRLEGRPLTAKEIEERTPRNLRTAVLAQFSLSSLYGFLNNMMLPNKVVNWHVRGGTAYLWAIGTTAHENVVEWSLRK